MFDRPRKPSRTGRFPDMDPTDRLPGGPPRPTEERSPGSAHPIEPPPIESMETNRSGESADEARAVADGETKRLARTIRDLIQSLPSRPAMSTAELPAPGPDGIAGAAAPMFEDQPTAGGQAELAEDGLASDVGPSDADRSGSPTGGCQESDTACRPDLRMPSHIGELSINRSIGLLPGDPGGGPTGSPAPNQPPLIEGAVGNPADPGDRAGGEDRPVGRYVEASPLFAAETSMAGSRAIRVGAGVGPGAGPGAWVLLPDRTPPEVALQGGDTGAEASETIAVGPVAPAGHFEEDFGRSPSSTTPSTTGGGSPGRDSFGTARAADEDASRVDLSPTNALLAQILDELRRHQQAAPIASGRSVYPER